MKNYRVVLMILFSWALIVACQNETIKILPNGNLNRMSSSKDTINTVENEIAPVQIPSSFNYKNSPFNREFDYKGEQLVFPSNRVAEQKLNFVKSNPSIAYLTNYVESISFINDYEGFVALSHPTETSKLLNIRNSSGGTDIYKFNTHNDSPEFENLNEINSEFWDSHPFSADTVINGKVYTLLIFSSDRESPYRTKISATNDTSLFGNADLYYVFAIDDQWGKVKKFASEINSPISNEGSPFLYCLCFNPTLFFSSNNGNAENDYDIFSVALNIDFLNQSISTSGDVVRLHKSDEKVFTPTDSTVNTYSDERFPYIPYPISNPDQRYIFVSSNRNSAKDYVQISKDSVLQNAGNYDIYKFPLSKNYSCSPPPPPKLFLKVRINEYLLSAEGDTLDKKKNVPQSHFLLNSEDKLSADTYEIQKSSVYLISRNVSSNECENTNCNQVKLITPNFITTDTTIEVELECVTTQKSASNYAFSFHKGLAFFVTGYWKPTTQKNLNECFARLQAGCLILSEFIDTNDYNYNIPAKINDDWLENSLYPTIDSVLNLIDNCNNQQKMVLTVHGYTDPCPLRTIREIGGKVIEEITTYSCDETIMYNGVEIPKGTLMKQPQLKYSNGKPFTMPYGVQRGNYLLAMLRAYYTSQTIQEGFREKFKAFPEKLKRFNELLVLRYDAFGIYDEHPCPYIYDDIVAKELPNEPILPEYCNVPKSRRVFVFIDLVPSQSAMSFQRGECGSLAYSSKPSKEEIPKENPLINSEENISIINLEEEATFQSAEPTEALTGGTACAGGDCFRVQYGRAENPSDFLILKELITGLGFSVLDTKSGSLDLLSEQIFGMESEAREYLKSFRNSLKKLEGIIRFPESKAKIKRI